jgi:hypothetical protein
MSTNPPLPQAKAQHYIPKFYLKGFTDKQGALWVYEKFKPLRKSKPKHEAHRPDYYTHAEDGERDETAEDVLKKVESQVAPIILKLANPQYMLTPKTAGNLVLFVAFMFARVPSWREYLDKITAEIARTKHLSTARDKQKFYKLCADMERSTCIHVNATREPNDYSMNAAAKYDRAKNHSYRRRLEATDGFEL